MRKVRIAIIGCGAIAERNHLPAVTSVGNIDVTLLVDKNRSRAQELANRYDVPDVAEDCSQVCDKADAAIVALPHYLHGPVSIGLLGNGIHVLVEKPMSLSTAECDAMIKAAKQGQAVLAVGLMRRFLHSARLVKRILQEGLLGPVRAFDIREGFIYNWPAASDFFFRKETAGGGVLLDTGAHTLDTLLWWLGDVDSVDYYDDSYGEVEADCKLVLVMKSGARGIVELSRTRNLRNTAIIWGEKATLEVRLHTNEIRLEPNADGLRIVGSVLPNSEGRQHEQRPQDLFLAQLLDWMDAIANSRLPYVSGTEGRRSVPLIENCYAQRKPLRLPWMTPDLFEQAQPFHDNAR